MIGVMFRFDNKITTEEGHPMTKVYMMGDNDKMRGLKQNGVRPTLAYVFKVEGSQIPSSASNDMMDWCHKSISYALHPDRGEIQFQNQELRDLFKLKL